MKVEFLTVAEAEFADAINYYNIQSDGLGFEFAVEVKQTIERIIRYPDAWSQLSLNTRRCRTNRFPYGVVYKIYPDKILIVAIMHLRRDPKTWKSRNLNSK